MNDTPTPGSEERERAGMSGRRPIIAAVALVALLVAAVVFVFRQRPRLNPEEEMLAGRWYFYAEPGDGENRLIGIEDYRPDHTMRIRGRGYVPDESSDVRAWKLDLVLEELEPELPTRWAVAGGTCEWHGYRWRGPEIWTNLQSWLRTGSWPKSAPMPSPRIVSLTADEKIFELTSADLTWRAVRIGRDFDLPDEPLTPEEALAWWAKRSGSGDDR